MSDAATEEAVRTATRFHRVKAYTPDRALCGVAVRFILDRKPVEDVADADRCRRCWSRPVGARLEWSSLQHRQGIRATSDGGTCDRCDGPILKEERIVPIGEHWGHAACHAAVHE